MDSIRVALSQYCAHHPHEEAFLERVTAFVAQTTESAELIARSNRIGHVTASGFVLDATRSAVLLVHHRGLGMYLQPGGHLDPTDESLVHGARREVREETGLDTIAHLPMFMQPDVPFDVDSHYIPVNTKKGEPEHWHHDFRYLFVAQEDCSLTLDTGEVAGARWVPIDELAAYPTLERVAAKLVRAVELGLNG